MMRSGEDGGVSFVMGTLMVVATTLSLLPGLVASSDFKGPPRVDPVEPFVLLSVGDNYKLTCPIKGSPTPMYEWFKDDEDITLWSRYSTKNSHLRLKEVEVNDSGRFKCLAINGFGQANFTFNVVVVEEELPPNRQLLPPVLTVVEPPSPVVVPIGEQVILECGAEGFPPPEIHWSKDGLSLKHSGPTLPLPAPRPGEGGFFSCTARNALGSASANFSVSVRAPERKIPKGGAEEGLVVAGAFNTTVMQGGNTTLQCTVTTDTRPEISWLREVPFEIATNKNNTLELQNRRFIVIKSTKSPPTPRVGVHATTLSSEQGSGAYLFNLNIQGARWQDQGLYACLGVNSRGYSYREAYLTVLPGPSQVDVWDGGVASEPRPNSNSFFIYIFAGVVVVGITATVIICRVRKRNFLRSTTTTTTTIASPPPKYEDPSSLTPLHPDKQKGGLPGLQPPPPQPQHGSSIKRGSRHNTIHSYNSTLPLPPPTLPPDLVYQHDGLVYPPGKSRPLPHGPSPGGLYSSDHYVYPTETSYLEPGYSDPYMERHSENSVTDSSLDLNYSEAMHSPHPNTPIPVPQHQGHPYHPHHHNNLHPTISNGVPGGGNNPHLTPNLPRHQQQQQVLLRNIKSDLNVQNTESSSNSKRSDSRTTTSNTNSPRDLSRSTAEQYYNSVSNSSCGGDEYSSPVVQQQQQLQKSYNSYLGNNYHPNISSSSNNSTTNNNKNASNNLTSRSSEHSYARLIPNTASPAPSPPFGITFPNGGGQSQYVVHYNL